MVPYLRTLIVPALAGVLVVCAGAAAIFAVDLRHSEEDGPQLESVMNL